MGTIPERLNPARQQRPTLHVALAWAGRAPAFFASAAVHLVLLLILSQLAVLPAPQPSRETERIINADLRPVEAPLEDNRLEEILKAIEEHKRQEANNRCDLAEVASDPAPAAEDTEADHADEDLPRDQAPTLVSSKPKIALGEGQPAATIRNRTPGGKLGALRDYGGNDASENAVRAALRWLKRHQDRSGKWDCCGFTRNCRPGSRCGGEGNNEGIDTGVTGLALLAFLGGGYYPDDGSEFGETAARATRYLLSVQDYTGRFGPPSSHEMYNHAIATLAVAEAYMLSRAEPLREPLKRGVNYLVNAQQAEGGWDYTAVRTGRSDTSVTGFVVMALKSAHAAGIEVPWMTIYGIIEYLDRMTQPSGEVAYANRGMGAGRTEIGMVAVSALCRQFLSWPLDAEVLRKQYAIMLRNPPQWEMLSQDPFHNTYYWYYGTLAMFQAGGENWKYWNENLRDMLIEHQRTEGCARGSWDPEGKWLGKVAGRVYATAINAMNLEVYYRYLPLYEARGLPSVEALVRASQAQGDMRLRALRLLREFRDQQSRQALAEALDDRDPFMQLNAAVSLIARGEAEQALPALIELSRAENGFIRSRAVDEMARLDSEELIPALIERLADEQDFIAARAAGKLRKLCRVNFNFDASADPARRENAIHAWRAWYVQYKTGQVQIDRSKVYGSVVNVKPNEVMLDVGSRDEVNPGDDFNVLRSGKVIARVRVFKVLQQFSAARVVQADVSVRERDIVESAEPQG